jgi:glycosyltransferase involved in cell wall biosynthesis
MKMMHKSSLNKKLKIAFVGNIANNFYREAKALQESSVLEVHLLIDGNESNKCSLPESDEPELKYNRPFWIKEYPGFKSSTYSLLCYYFGLKQPLRELNNESIEILNNYDLCVTSNSDSRFLQFLSTIKFFRVTGADITVFPLFTFKEYERLRGGSQHNFFRRLVSILSWPISKKLCADSIRSAHYVDIGFGAPFVDAADRLGIEPAKRISLFRLAIDKKIFKRRDFDISLKKYNLNKQDFHVFYPSRLMIRDYPELVKSGQWKASDRGIRGFYEFLSMLSREERSRVKLIIPKRTIQDDFSIAYEIIKGLDISDYIIFLTGKDESGLSRDEMIDIYSISSAVMDDFGAGWYGSVVVESLSCATPVVTYVPEQALLDEFSWHPLQLAQSEKEIADRLHKLYLDNEYFKMVSEKSVRWINDHHCNDVINLKLETGIRKLLTEQGNC